MKTGVAYFHTRDPRHVERDLDDMLEHGCNFVVHCFSELDMAFYNQAMERIIRLSKDRGLEVYLDPWGLGGVYGGESFSRFVAEHPEARQVDCDGAGRPAACPNHPDFRALQARWIERAADLGADVCFWDEPHFYFNFYDMSSWERWACRCPVCQDLYKRQTGTAMPQDLTDELERFRQEALVDFLTDNCRQARKLGMRNCVCVLPDEGAGLISRAAGTASWERIAAIEEVDVFGTDPYWVLFGGEVREYVSRHCMEVKRLCDQYGKQAQAWVLAFAVPEGRESEVGTAVEVMLECGIENIAAWAYRGCDLIDIRCARPEMVWEILGKAFSKAREATAP